MAWWKEKDDFNLAKNSCVPGKVCGHYTQVGGATAVRQSYVTQIHNIITDVMLYIPVFATLSTIAWRSNKNMSRDIPCIVDGLG